MIRQSFLFASGILGFGVMLELGPAAMAEPPSGIGQAQAVTSQQAGVEFLARGPVHEAFAEPTLGRPAASPVITKQPPKPIEELPPDQIPEGANVHWIPGYWAWDDDTSNFLWVSGTYRATPPGRHWAPGYWNQANGGWQWVAGLWADQALNHLELLPTPPSEPVEQAVPPAPDATSIFQPGSWVYRDSRYLWQSGFWTPYQAGWTWSPAAYVWTPGGYIFNNGYWDYPLRERGLLFAPVNIERRFWSQPGWVYRPSYVIPESFLLSALFVRPSYSHYYFGDYFAPGYDRLGFVPWTNYRHGRTVVDPLFGHYQAQFRGNPGWSRDLRQTYAARRQDPAARPPRTLVQQNTMIQNINLRATGGQPSTNLKRVIHVR